MSEREGQRSSVASRDIAAEDFLFHLYRGSELLQDDRVHEAKSELEQALSLQPLDPKGQDLLGIVYFRLGLYPRAITIYEHLIRIHPEAIEPRINLALCYLKTGQPSQARFELEKVVEHNPGHSRAWGYLGLAFQRLGDYERASYAFQTGGHEGMARRLAEMIAASAGVPIQPSPPPPEPASTMGGPQRSPQTPPGRDVHEAQRPEAAHELDKADAFKSAEEQAAADPPSEAASSESAREPARAPWSSIELGREAHPTTAPFPPIAVLSEPPAPPSSRALASYRPAFSAAKQPIDFLRGLLLVFPRDHAVAKHTSGVVLVQSPGRFAVRFEAIRSAAFAVGTGTVTLPRRARGRALDEPLGGPASPLLEITGKGELVLAPHVGHSLEPLMLGEELFYLREDALVAFDLSIGYENGRLPVGDGEALGMLQLRGPGAVVMKAPETMHVVEVIEGRSTTVRATSVVGWMGKLVPSASDVLTGARGHVTFAGEGMVLVDVR